MVDNHSSGIRSIFPGHKTIYMLREFEQQSIIISEQYSLRESSLMLLQKVETSI